MRDEDIEQMSWRQETSLAQAQFENQKLISFFLLSSFFYMGNLIGLGSIISPRL